MISKKQRYFIMLLSILGILMMALCISNEAEDVPNLEPIIEYSKLDIGTAPLSIKSRKPFHVVKDKQDSDLRRLMTKANRTYVIRYNHTVDSLIVPEGSQIYFDGGSISGKIYFANTYLSGKVRLTGAELSGKISNSCFHSGWLCYGDGVRDDANNINSMIAICDSIVFQEGTYLLISQHRPDSLIKSSLHENVKSRIGIYQSNKHLEGEGNVVFLTREANTTCSIYSKPYDITSSITNVSIRNITFKVENEGKNFYEFKHTIKTMGVNGLTIENCTFHDFWGDAICLSHFGDTPSTGERTRNSNVRLLNNVIYGGSHNNRNGISIISGEHVLVDGNKIYETSKKGMPGAIDVEPNNSAYTVDDIIISNNIINSSKGSGICLVSPGGEAPLYNITIMGNRVSKVSYGVSVIINSNNSTANFSIYDNVFSETYKDYRFSGSGDSKNWKIQNNSSTPSPDRDFKKGLHVSGLSIEHNNK